jgi:hypothetical protein
MWSKARAVAALYNKLDNEACKVTVDFKLPIFLPTCIQLNYQMESEQIDFVIRDKAGIKPHMKGSISAL